uniref:Uncharacterized protein n=1 Tax=Panagrolaimus sp. PS1159 TaxID=55785 RepID=A0AC35EW81_9BILA
AYNNMVTMHEKCLAIRKIIEECGSISREIDDLTDEIEIESQNASNIRLEELMTDINQIRQENETLFREKEILNK